MTLIRSPHDNFRRSLTRNEREIEGRKRKEQGIAAHL